MKIVDKKSALVPFKDISCGEVFKDHLGFYCMKIEECVAKDSSFRTNYIYLSDGAVAWSYEDLEYEKVDCELHINN